jgi:hypothetical protein
MCADPSSPPHVMETISNRTGSSGSGEPDSEVKLRFLIVEDILAWQSTYIGITSVSMVDLWWQWKEIETLSAYILPRRHQDQNGPHKYWYERETQDLTIRTPGSLKEGESACRK